MPAGALQQVPCWRSGGPWQRGGLRGGAQKAGADDKDLVVELQHGGVLELQHGGVLVDPGDWRSGHQVRQPPAATHPYTQAARYNVANLQDALRVHLPGTQS